MLLRQTLLFLPAQVLGPLFQFIGIVLWTHWLSPKDMGMLALILVAQELAFVAAIGWFSLYTIRYAGQLADRSQLDRYLGTETRLLLLVCAGIVPFTVALLAYLDGGRPTAPLLVTTLAYAIARTLTQHLQDRARASEAILAYTCLHVTGPALGMGLALIAVMHVEATPAAILAGYAAGHLVGLSITPWTMAVGRSTGALDRQILAAAIAYGWPFIVASPALWICGNALRYLVDYFEGMVAVGLVTAGWGLGQRATSFAALLVAVASFPLAVRRTHDEGLASGMAQLNRNGMLLVLVLAPATLGLIVLAGPLSTLLVAAPYRATTELVLPWATAAGAIRAVRVHFTNQVFLLHERPKAAMLVDIVDAVATVVACALGLRLAGLPGAVIGATLAALAALSLSVVWGVRRLQFEIDWSGLARIAAAAAIMAVAVRLLAAGSPLVSVAVGIAIGCVVYAGAILALLPDARAIAAGLVRRLRGKAPTP